MESSRQLVIAETAQRFRDDGDMAGAEEYLHAEIKHAIGRGDLTSQVIAMQWLATTLALDDRRQQGADFARQACEASRSLAPSVHVQAALTLAGLLSGFSDASVREAEETLLGLDTTEVDDHYEDMRLQRLETVYRRSGRADEAMAIQAQLLKLRSSGHGFKQGRDNV